MHLNGIGCRLMIRDVNIGVGLLWCVFLLNVIGHVVLLVNLMFGNRLVLLILDSLLLQMRWVRLVFWNRMLLLNRVNGLELGLHRLVILRSLMCLLYWVDRLFGLNGNIGV